jgi:hypothetical protein
MLTRENTLTISQPEKTESPLTPADLTENHFQAYIGQEVIIDFHNGDSITTTLKGASGSQGNMWLSVEWGIIDADKMEAISIAKFRPHKKIEFVPL